MQNINAFTPVVHKKKISKGFCYMYMSSRTGSFVIKEIFDEGVILWRQFVRGNRC